MEKLRRRYHDVALREQPSAFMLDVVFMEKELCMNRWLHCWIILILIFMACGSPLFADIDQSVLDLLTGLSSDYAEYREEVFFKVPLAVVPFADSGPLAKEHEKDASGR